MISKIPVTLKDNSYSIAIGHGIWGQLPEYLRKLLRFGDVLSKFFFNVFLKKPILPYFP